MCCKINKDIIPFHEGEEEKTFYKVVTRERLSPYYSDQFYLVDFIIQSNRDELKLNFYEGRAQEIDQGIHVFLSEEVARVAMDNIAQWKGVGEDHFRIIQVSCRKEDLIGAGHWDGRGAYPTAVFMKVKVLD